LTVAGAISADGGVGGSTNEAATFHGVGGLGAVGRIRLDSTDSNLAGATISPSPGDTGPLVLAMSGSTRTPVIAPVGLCSWGAVMYTADVPSGSTLTVNVLDSSNAVLLTDVTSGTNLASIITATTQIELEADFATTNGMTPTLHGWRVDYTTH
jgi:hypothetical protein